jgi:thiamine transporter
MRTTKLTEIAVLVSMAVVLEVIFTGLGAFIPFLQLPYGGRVSLSMLPLFMLTYRHGVKEGVIGGTIYGLLNFLLDGVLYHWGSLFLDYLFAFGAIGFSALVFRFSKKNRLGFVYMVVLGVSLRFLFSYLSGVVIFVMILGWMPEEFNNPWWYSFVYNIYYLLPSMILVIVTGLLLFDRMERLELFES